MSNTTDNNEYQTALKSGNQMDGQLFSQEMLKRFEIKKPAKNENRKRLIDKIAEATGWSKRSVHFSTIHFPDKWLEDALEECLHYSNPKLRNMKFRDFIKSSKLEEI